MKVLVTGSNGQLGRELRIQLKDKNINFVGYDIPEFDITDKAAISEIITKEEPDVIINCGAMTNVDGCETNREAAFKINADGPKNLAEIAKEKDIVLVQVSTDYVFDGEGLPKMDSFAPMWKQTLLTLKQCTATARPQVKNMWQRRWINTSLSVQPGSMVMVITL